MSRSETTPLQKWLQWAGIGSKAAVRELIRDGRVRVDGAVVTRYAEPLDPTALITVDDEPVLGDAEPTVLLLHKPIKHLTQLEDDDDGPGLGRYLPADAPRLFPVGRLDYNTSGALLLCNDGQLARRILHPDWSLPKRYEVKVRGHLDAAHPAFDAMRQGMHVRGEQYRPIEVQLLDYRTRATWIELVLREGRHRQIRRMCAASRFQIVKLRRVGIGPIELGDLNPRVCRPLSDAETGALRRAVQLEPEMGV